MATDRGVTVVRSQVPDQAALQGLISRINALGLELLDVHLVAEPGDDTRVGPTPRATAHATGRHRRGRWGATTAAVAAATAAWPDG